jgi:glycosyltransferase involved in cell wall biosynthesis
LTRDRLPYTKHCFETLRRFAGCDYDHYVVDQGSTDGTPEWLEDDDTLDLFLLDENVGICRGLNLLLEHSVDVDAYDVIVRFDNDCEVVWPDTLRVAATLAAEHEVIVAPKVEGLLSPPPTLSRFRLGGRLFLETAVLGGIFMAIPARLFGELGYRYDERNPPWGGDEQIVPWWRSRGGRAGYVAGYPVNHYETTAGQRARFPGYEARKREEMVA